MKKIFDYIKAHPCITIIHTLGALMILRCFFSEPWAATGARNFIHMFFEPGNRRVIPAGALSFLGFGAYSASHRIDREREGTGFLYFVKGCFFILLWFFVYYLVSWLLYQFGYYSWS